MKILKYETNQKDDLDEQTVMLLREVERIVCKYHYLVPRGWRFIIKMQNLNESEPYYCLDIQDDKGGGSYATAKMSTLEMFPERAVTGGDNLCNLVKALKKLNATKMLEQISTLESIDLLTEDMWSWLRDVVGFVPCYGGLRIQYKGKVVEAGHILDKSGETRIAFSGATSEQDLFFALMIFRALNNSFPRFCPNTQEKLDLSKIREVPEARLWLDILGIEEA